MVENLSQGHYSTNLMILIEPLNRKNRFFSFGRVEYTPAIEFYRLSVAISSKQLIFSIDENRGVAWQKHEKTKLPLQDCGRDTMAEFRRGHRLYSVLIRMNSKQFVSI